MRSTISRPSLQLKGPRSLRSVRFRVEGLEARQMLAADLLVGSYSTGEVLRYDGATGAFEGAFVSSGYPQGMTFGPDGAFYIANEEPGSSRVERFDGSNGSPLGTFASGGGLAGAHQIVFGPDGHLYVVSLGTNDVLRYDGSTGAFLDTFISLPGADTTLSLELTSSGDWLVGSDDTDDIRRYDSNGGLLGVFAAGGGLDYPHDLAFGPDGDLYVASLRNGKVIRYDGVTGALIGDFASGLVNPISLGFDPDGQLYVSTHDGLASKVARFDGQTGASLGDFVPAGLGGLYNANALLFHDFDPPPSVVALGDSYSADEDRTLTVGAGEGVLANDSAESQLPLTATLVSGPAHGSLALAQDGSFTYTPAANFFGVDSFVYTASDGSHVSGPASATITVRDVLDVAIDVKPGNPNNVINVANNGTLAVAILSDAAIDAAMVDPTSVEFAGAHAVHSSLADVDCDGDLDLVLHFRTQDTALRALYEQLIEQDLDEDGVLDSNRQQAQVALSGATFDDVLFDGSDDVRLFLAGRALRDLLSELAARGSL